MEEIFDLIREERKWQDQKWGADRTMSNFEWITILIEEIGEVAEAMLKDWPTVNTELIHVAAVAVAWLESIKAGRIKNVKHQSG